jgi:dsRNA-specific ribonuclease
MSISTILEWAFHAYVGAVHNEHGLVNTLGWITGLYASYVISSYPIFSTSRPGNMANTNQPHNRSEESQTLASPTSAPPFQPTFGSLQQLNEILVQQKVLHRLEWTAINAALSHAPRWRLEAIFLCKDDQKRIIGCGVDTRKQNAKWAAAVQALEWLLQHGEISPKLPDE